MRGSARVATTVVLLAAAMVLPGCGTKSRVAYKELLDKDPLVRADAAVRLGQAKAVEAVDSLLAVLDDSDEGVRVAVLRSLGDIGDRRAVPAVIARSGDPLQTVRVAACQSLGRLQDPKGIPTLTQMLNDADGLVRFSAARALGKIGTPEAVDVLVNLALQDENERTRELVVKVIGERETKSAIPRLESALRAESDAVRANAAQVLGRIADASSVPVLIRALDDPYEKVRSLSAHSLSALAPKNPEALAAMKKRIGVETHGMARVDLAWNLARGGDRSEMEAIRTLLVTGDPEDVRAEAAWALGEVGDASDVRRLQKAFHDKRGPVRKQVYLALQKLEKKP